MLHSHGALAVAFIALGLQTLPLQAQDLSAGRALAEKKCARCHAVAATDESKLKIAPPFRVIAGRYSVWGLQEALAEGIVVGHPVMPEFVLEPIQITNLLSYMASLVSKPEVK
jgi:mono/diheme cytochrome c family protein